MARTLRRLTPLAGALPLGCLWALPLLLGALATFASLGDSGAWAALFAHPQLWPALALSLFTGTASTVMALACTLLILAGLHGSGFLPRMQAIAAAGLALPHLAFAIGFGFLLMPSGLLARLIAGGAAPPQWVSVQDPLGLSLTAALAIKEVPFLLTAALGTLARGDRAAVLGRELRAAASLGHGRGSAWLRVALPPLLRDLRWPVVIVLAYGATVVDMALVLGPTQPPTLAVVIWHALNDAEPQANRMGLAATLLLTLGIAAVLAAWMAARRWARAAGHRLLSAGPSRLAAPRAMGLLAAGAIAAMLLLAVLLLGLLSLAPRWPWPAVLPPAASAAAWAALAQAPAPLWLSLGLAGAAAVSAVGLAVLWFESQPAARDRWVLGMALLCLALPQLAVAGGQYRLFLGAGLSGTLPGLFLAHLTPVAAYVLIVLQGPYRAFDGRYMAAARALSVPRAAAWRRVKLPLLKAPLLTALAIGFAVSMAQFVPAQLVAAGRFSTLPMEAVTLSAGGSRPLAAAFALALGLPPLLGFLAAAVLGRPRWR